MEQDEYRIRGLINNLSPRSAFRTGMLTGLGIVFLLGFFVLLGILFTKNDGVSAYNQEVKDNGNPLAVAPDSAGTGDINIKPVSAKNDWIKGDRNARISIIEFSDSECPFCQRFHSTMQQIVAEYDGEVNWIYRHFPLVSLHSKASKEAEATECAGEQGGNDAFWAYIDELFAITPANNGLDLNQLPEIAGTIGLDVDQFQTCLDSGKYAQKIQNSISEAQAAGARGTPYSVILAGDKKLVIPGALPLEQVKSMIDTIL
ncbi:MAG: hypothetical protein COV55_00365 [Candidatus Komeilibacteria bacterium CG11_big_fil_rev_8_21_14_0_20_36_20]|uniref:Thioredoxin domain-containing protein n=2 Tax=Patescibacteria group TaxID=1783273 RepID=A0A2H0NEE8_9BACT|nr:MAG: hypothetical protein COV55_00365 [Candidatus Komeilibacteria bacterium CG11_big_fil_rev_8_21_14_0_20_36_20]PIR82108.1 MAG: hypothetical protein COU21_00060 [Candidatus Komeilibacteria bacterium CG10_big_fil_rev_8_21_14_0_10_36_65]PIZ66452.1 MAG: hypothetical protein COY14_00315 [Candidatus Roizmanbacteria bacterium CG_4_10_14_0_2_um_filter_36_9]PJC55780.1 MAG: hypothetical protein CO027_00260 [Candidatus Komeilibacteria bacterium CG_4_9_14_0_2_um_filter_36_13]